MLEVTSYETVDPLIGKGKPLLLELGSTSCGGCRDMARSLYHIKQQYPQSGIYFIDIKRERYAARQYGVRMMPTQVILDGEGNVVDTHVGVSATQELTEKLKRYGVIEAY
jgi:thioredoxin 1